MQLHQLKPSGSNKKRKRVGRGGSRGTYSGRGQKGQKSRASTSIRPDFRGGSVPLWKIFGKKRGSSKKVDIKHRAFRIRNKKPIVVKLSQLNHFFKDGDTVTLKNVIKAGLADKSGAGIKILSNGEITKKLNFVRLPMSASAKNKVTAAGGTVK
ncbi:MAG: 50S ribosomal protein L15 [bacterium]|nr:50S ribosomal protein L15 [bacterium]